MKKNLIIGTAGHVDHGKTTLIKALTGEDTDRLKEEKERGLSIDLGFSSLQLAPDIQVGIIDVPGHEKFIKNMLAGAGGVDIALMIIAADEAVMPQTEEHLAILDLLGVEEGLVAVTKRDLVDEEWLKLVVEEIKSQVTGTFLEGAPVFEVSGKTGEGLEELKKKIIDIAEKIPAKDNGRNLYLPIDRVFTLAGQGTIVTGTLIEGTINIGDQLEIYPPKLKARVRSLQVHGKDVDKAYPGQRVGVNLAGIDKKEVGRGDILAAKDSLRNTQYLDAQLKLLSSSSVILKHGDRIRLYLGAKEIMGRVYLLDKEELYPGEEGWVQFKAEEKIAANFKEKYILRRYSPMTTIGGGEILEPNPERHSRFDEQVISELKTKESGSLQERIKLVLKQVVEKPLTVKELTTKTRLNRKNLKRELQEMKKKEEIVELNSGQDSRWLHQLHYRQFKKEIIGKLQQYHQNYPLRIGMKAEELRTKLSLILNNNEYNLLLNNLKQEDKIRKEKDKVRLADFKIKLSAKERKLKDKIINKLLRDKFSPPGLNEIVDNFKEEELVKEIYSFLVEKGELIKVREDLYFHSQAVEEAEQILKSSLNDRGEIRVAEFRDLLNNSRKYALPLLNYFDQQRVTIRKGDKRVLYN